MNAMAMTKKERELFQQTFAALKTTEAALIESQRKLKATGSELLSQRMLVRAACDAKDAAVFRVELYTAPNGEMGVTVASSAGPDRELLQARIAGGVLAAMFTANPGEPEDQHLGEDEAEEGGAA